MPYVTIRKNRFFYRIAPDAACDEKPTLVLLHGSGGDSTVWGNQLLGLKNVATVIAADLPGHGSSNAVVLESVRDYALWVKEFLLQLTLNSFFLAGHSLGGAIAQEFGRKFPEMVQGLILVGCGMSLQSPDTFMRLVKNDFSAAIEKSCRTAFSPDTVDRHYREAVGLLSRNGSDVLYKDMITCNGFNSRSWISTLEVPVLVLCGSEDKITPPLLSMELSTALSKSKQAVISGAGHMVMMEAPERVNKVMGEFIKTHRNKK